MKIKLDLQIKHTLFCQLSKNSPSDSRERQWMSLLIVYRMMFWYYAKMHFCYLKKVDNIELHCKDFTKIYGFFWVKTGMPIWKDMLTHFMFHIEYTMSRKLIFIIKTWFYCILYSLLQICTKDDEVRYTGQIIHHCRHISGVYLSKVSQKES